MYSPVFLSRPTTSGSPPVLSISLSDHSFSVLACSFACTSAHAIPLWRLRLFSKRVFSVLSSSARCFGENFSGLSSLFIEYAQAPNDNNISDGWRGRAWLRVEGGISWKVRNRACQPFAASLG